MLKVTHLTSVHARYDTRIFHKMCISLAKHGFDVKLVVADGKDDEVISGIAIIDVGAPKGRFHRMRTVPAQLFKKAIELKSDLYHLHDPELLPMGLKLKRAGHRVIFDSHEDIPDQILAKPYLTKSILRLISKIFSLYQTWVCSKLDGVIVATPIICNKFQGINSNTVNISNFPIPGELGQQTTWEHKSAQVCYVGAISRIRGINEICSAMGQVQSNVRLSIVGCFSEQTQVKAVRSMQGWQRVKSLGFLDREGVREELAQSIAGLVVLHPVSNYINALPVKMFEYMSVGIPVIASDFPAWREIISASDCGLLVNPLDSAEIARAIDYLILNPNEARRMGMNGLRAVNERYNWLAQEKNLLAFYEKLLEVN